MGSPKYVRVMEYLQEQCAAQEPHTPIDSERDIAAKLSISRMTVRKAVEELCRQGVLYRDGNRGTFVSEKVLQRQQQELPERRRILFVDSVYDGSNVSQAMEALMLEPHERLFRLVRLVLQGNTALRIEEIYAPEHNVSDEELGNLDTSFNLDSLRSEGISTNYLEPILIPTKYANLLGMKAGEPIIRKDETIRQNSGIPRFYVQTYYNPRTSILSL